MYLYTCRRILVCTRDPCTARGTLVQQEGPLCSKRDPCTARGTLVQRCIHQWIFYVRSPPHGTEKTAMPKPGTYSHLTTYSYLASPVLDAVVKVQSLTHVCDADIKNGLFPNNKRINTKHHLPPILLNAVTNARSAFPEPL